MYKVKHNKITKEVLKELDQKFVPDVDYFYFEDRPNFVLVNERETVDLSLDLKTSYLPWNISAKARYIAIVSNEEFLSWEEELQKAVLIEQIRLNRGYIFELDELRKVIGDIPVEVQNALDTFSINIDGMKMITLQGFLWENFLTEIRTNILLYVANMFVDMDSISDVSYLNALKREYPSIVSLLNTFGSKNGPNCLGAELIALQKDEDTITSYLNKWVLPAEFYKELKNKDYVRIETDSIQSNDVLIWEKDHNTFHSCFVLSNGLVFNKQGQTMFNPYQCLPLEDVLNNWNWVEASGGHLVIYRKNEV
ncbi:hypothetical protein CN692_23685 [Bacillus sp. AFS002410]|uniref:hypothetical protein n=1 Tax=Bacillus sp. AFS002410 TaxID=2033481 RepID=UPI000BF21334|nr:hypothetical protein [Bacillus sp. AFS002410]PEJ48463.1 hypothetical protein CN692_23685 [Bacillus sp. AFS002410]